MYFIKLLTIAALSTLANVEAQLKPSIRGRPATAAANEAGGGALGTVSINKFDDQRNDFEVKMLAKEEDNVRLTAENNLLKAEILALKAKIQALESRNMIKEDFVGVNGATSAGSCPPASDERCSGREACDYIKWCSNFQVGPHSCIGENSCSSSGATIESHSCTGNYTCADSNGSVGSRSCTANYSCWQSQGTIGSGSCTAINSCGMSQETIGSGSCTGPASCYLSQGTIGSGSCLEESSCRESTGTIGSGSCTGQTSCYGSQGTVGNYACTAYEGCYELPPDVDMPDNCASKADKDDRKCNNWYNQRYNTENRVHGCVIAEGKVASPESAMNPKQCALECTDGCFGIQYNIDGGTCSNVTSSIISSDLGECENDDVLVYLKNPRTPPVSVEALE